MTGNGRKSTDALSTLKHCCKMSMYSLRINGQSTPIDGYENTFVRVQAEEMKPGEREFVHRIVLLGENQAYAGVGWVVDADCDACMSCHTKFGMTKWRHHCRMCGNNICNSCSPHRVDLNDECDLQESGLSRVCNQCYVDLHFRMARIYDGEPDEMVEAVNPAMQEAPTPTIKSRKQPMKGTVPVNSSGLMNPKSILKTGAVDDKKDLGVSPVTAMLNNLDGRWDRSDDGISTPGSLPASSSDSSRGTPDDSITSDTDGVRTAPSSAKSTATDKYFFTPNSAFGNSTNSAASNKSGAQSRAVSAGRKVLGDVTQERMTPKGGSKKGGSSSSRRSGGGGLASKKGSSGKKTPSSSASREERENADGNYSPLPDTPATAASTSPEKPSSTPRFVPVPSFVVKGTVDNFNGVLGCSKTVYVNVCKHGSVPVPTSKQLKSSDIAVSYVVGEVNELARDGETILCVDVCYHNQVHVWAYADENGMNLSALAEHAVVCVNSRHNLNMWISSLPQYTTYQGNVKPLEMRVHHGQPPAVEA